MIDVHTHCLLAKHWGPEWKDNWQPVYHHDYPDVSPAEFDEAMVGVDAAVVFGLRATAVGVATPNEYVEWFCATAKTKTVGFMSLDLCDDDVLDQLEDGVSRGLQGIKLYPVLARFDARDRKHDAFYAAVRRHGLALLWHMGATPSPAGDLALSQPLIVDDVARRYPDVKQVIAHLGHPWQRETLVVLRKNRNVYSDLSALWARPYDGYRALVRAQEWGVVDKVLFGSDFPLWTPADAAAQLREIGKLSAGNLPGIADDTLDQIFDAPTLSVLGLEAR